MNYYSRISEQLKTIRRNQSFNGNKTKSPETEKHRDNCGNIQQKERAEYDKKKYERMKFTQIQSPVSIKTSAN